MLKARLRTSVHDELTKLMVVFLKAAGYIDVKLEDRTWDVGPRVAQARQDLGRNLHQHRRPDIVCRHPYSGRVYVLDTTIAWRGMANAGLAYAEPGWAAAKAEARKNAAYAAALERQAERFGNGERFVPLSFEISSREHGGWGCGSYSRRAASWRGASVARISSTGALWNLWDIGGSA